MRLRDLAVSALLLDGCRPVAPAPAPAPAAIDEPRGCDGSLVTDEIRASEANLASAFVCDPRPDAAKWVSSPNTFAGRPELPRTEPPPLDVNQPRFALVFDGREGPRLGHALATLRSEADYRILLASTAAPPGVAVHAPPTAAGVTELLAVLRRELAPGAMLVIVAAEVVETPDDPWGCIPLADACYPLGTLRHDLEGIRAGARAVVLEQARPRLAFAALADAASVVTTFPSGQVGAAAARAFWSSGVPDGDGDGVIALRERAAHARRRAPQARFVDPLGVLSFARRSARARGRDPLEVQGRAELDRAVATLAPGEIAVVNLSTTWCAACEPFRAEFAELSRRTGGALRFIHAETDEQWQGFGAPSYPAVAFIAPGGRLLGVAADAHDPLASLAIAQLDAIDDRLAHHRSQLRSSDAPVRSRAVRAIIALGAPGAALAPDLARDLHDEPVAAIVLDILLALGSYGPAAREFAPELLALFNHADEYVRSLAVVTLQRVGADPRALACPLVALVADPSSGVRKAATELLAAHPSLLPSLLPALRVVMEDAVPGIRMAALVAFRRLPWGDAAAEALPTLVRLATPGEPEGQREEAMAAIVDLGPRAAAAVPDLARLLADHEPAIRRQAALALGNCGAAAGCAVAALAALDGDPDVHTRRKAAEAQARIAAAAPTAR
ncbi:hypothetical protein [Nannocystis pusilla]|uniref:Thioredoxin domain-containing protein n=1 Tax=Nannocystis pusilla TaxID=889268 RepID=A0ABS7TI01_9BACT|nr:hypothetical protein [Nannocystis pusilla]MBZ5707844.1 hypothetical protein [Nannocystis pusilla]